MQTYNYHGGTSLTTFERQIYVFDITLCVTTNEKMFFIGPSVILAFLIAFVVTLLNALCFAEFAAKNPKTGANYTYMYETVGEAVAFIIGWNSLFGK